MSLSPEFENLYSANFEFVEAAKKAEKLNGLKEHFSEFYPDEAHYLYELLQNAEDAEARKVSFNLCKTQLEFYHDGKKLFDVNDIKSITNIADSNKKNDESAIGKFGVGFKSVFAYTETPKIFSGEYAFEIIDLFVPRPIENGEFHKLTKFLLPFNHNKKNRTTAFEETQKGILDFKDNMLLFLNHIEEIEWSIEGLGSGYLCRVAYEDNHFEIERKVNNTTTDRHWLIFRDSYNTGPKHLQIAIALELDFLSTTKTKAELIYNEKLPLSKQMEIVPIDKDYLKGQTSIYFPCEKEEPKLNFHINGPFSSTPDRSKLNSRNTENTQIINSIAKLLADSLSKIRDYGLFKRSFYEVLPNTNDNLSDFYLPILNETLNALKTQPLLPTLNEKIPFAPANKLMNSYQAVKELFKEENYCLIKLGLPEDFAGWVDGLMIGAGRREERREPQLLTDLNITNINWDNFLENLCTILTSDPMVGKALLSDKDDTWLRSFYLIIYEARIRANARYDHRLKRCYLIPPQTSQWCRCEEMYFPVDKRSPVIREQPKVKPELLEDSKEENNNKIIELFEILGVKHLNDEEIIHILLNEYYCNRSKDPESDQKHFEHLRRFISAWFINKSKYTELFRNHYILRGSDNKYYMPTGLYIDKPYRKTSLSVFYKSIEEPSISCVSDIYKNEFRKTIDRFIEFITQMGVHNTIEIEERNVPESHPDYNKLDRNGNKGKNTIDRDFFIPDLDEIFKKKDINLNLMIWERIINADSNQFRITFYLNSRTEFSDCYPSSLIYQLRKNAWIPDTNGNFHYPCDITKEMLNKSFRYNNSNGWLTEIGFGAADEKSKAEMKEKVKILKQLGIEKDDVDDFLVFKGIPKDKREKLLRQAAREKSFPVRTSSSPDNRQLKIATAAAIAPEIEYEKRMRSVRTSNNDTTVIAKTFLMESYTRESGELVCQICEEDMPFRLDSGLFYFEAVQLIENPGKEFDKNYIALCPVCAAKFKHANASKKDLFKLILEAKELKVPVTLARESKAISFVETHLIDIKAQLNSQTSK